MTLVCVSFLLLALGQSVLVRPAAISHGLTDRQDNGTESGCDTQQQAVGFQNGQYEETCAILTSKCSDTTGSFVNQPDIWDKQVCVAAATCSSVRFLNLY
jgi:hypothetical protein